MRKLPWWAWKTTEFAGSGLTTVGPFWLPVHYWNTFTQIRGWYWKLRGY